MHVYKMTVGEHMDNDTPWEAPAGPLGVPLQEQEERQKLTRTPNFLTKFRSSSSLLELLELADLFRFFLILDRERKKLKQINGEDEKNKYFLGGFFFILYSALLHLPPLRFHCADGCYRIEPRTVATDALAVRRSNH